VSQIRAVASHIGHQFSTGRVGSDISPVAWKVLAEQGIAARGREPSTLGLDPQPELLRQWNLGNLEAYWRPWAVATAASPRSRLARRPRWSTAWGVLGPPRLHYTIATGGVISKEAAGEYALDVFPPRWHPLIGEALAYWRHEPARLQLSLHERSRLTAAFVIDVIDAARDLGTTS